MTENVCDAMTELRLRLLISGRVQGVGFRAFALREARWLGVSGYVRNLVDGRVEAVVQGSSNQVEALISACRRGPMHARVHDVATELATGGDLPFPFEMRADGSVLA